MSYVNRKDRLHQPAHSASSIPNCFDHPHITSPSERISLVIASPVLRKAVNHLFPSKSNSLNLKLPSLYEEKILTKDRSGSLKDQQKQPQMSRQQVKPTMMRANATKFKLIQELYRGERAELKIAKSISQFKLSKGVNIKSYLRILPPS